MEPGRAAAGPFLDVTVGWAATDIDDSLPARHERTTAVALAIPPFGFSYYRLSITDIGQLHTIAADSGGREDRRAAVPNWSLSASQFGATLVHSLVSGVHVGLSEDGTARFRDDSHPLHARRNLRRAQIAEVLPARLPQPRHLLRSGDQSDSR